MSRRPRVRYSLDTGNIKSLPQEEICAILRAADELIAAGGRNMLVKILKGSKDRAVLEHELDQCPSYGFYSNLTMEEISHRVDWMIKKDYLRIEYNGRLPMLVFSEKGWAIERETYAEELYERCCLDVQEKQMRVIYEMKDVNRQVVFDILEKIRASRNEEFLPFLEEWKALEVRKVRGRIDSVEATIRSQGEGPVTVCLKAQKGDAGRIAELIEKTVRAVNSKDYSRDVADFLCFLYSRERIKAKIEVQCVWILLYDGKLAGAGCVNGNTVDIVCVLPDMQRRGLGRQILEKLEYEIGREFNSVQLDVIAPDKKFYEKCGYREVKKEILSIGTVRLPYTVMGKGLSQKNGEPS